MATMTETQLINATLFEQLHTPGQEKEAADSVNDFTRTRVREEGVWPKVLPPLPLENSELDRQVDTDKPVKVIDREPDSPAAISIPFGTLPTNVYIRGSRYRVTCDRVVSPRFSKDVDELRTWVMDIRQVISDNAIKDMLAEIDGKAIAGVNAALMGADTPVPWSGVAQWETITGGITRETAVESLKTMPRTDAHLEVMTCLTNNITIKEFQKWGRDEMGGDFSQDVVRKGWADGEFLDRRWLVTIKRDLVPDDSVFQFADAQFIGKYFELEECTMYIKRDAYMLEFFAYMTSGCTIGHTGGLARIDFT